MPVTKDKILAALRFVRDDSNKDIVGMGMVKSVAVDGRDVTIQVEMSTPTSEAREGLKAAIEDVISTKVKDLGHLIRVHLGPIA